MLPEIPVTPANAPSTPAYKRSDAEQSTLNLRRRKNEHLDTKKHQQTIQTYQQATIAGLFPPTITKDKNKTGPTPFT